MLFNSLVFLAFFLLVLAIYHLAPLPWRGRKLLLLLASWAFYATWSPRFLVLLVGTTWLDFHLARWIHRARQEEIAAGRADPRGGRARALLVASLASNLGLLAFFKYGRFFWESGASVLPLGPPPSFLSVAVPLGISFYTFHSISYVIDTYRGIRPPTDSFGDFALYVAFFPQLVAGPITRWGFFGPQLAEPPIVHFPKVDAALSLLAVGFVKKVLLADPLGGFVDTVYAAPASAAWVECVIAFYAYAFQIYFDFSGYTDIAMGLAALLGFRLPENFRHPYHAENPSEFWRRWHMSLSTWLRDYLYVPLGGNRRGTARTYGNLFVTMVLGGLWHGAAWTFVLWGAFHGAWLALHRALSGVDWWRPARREAGGAPRTPAWLRRVVTFHLVCLAWVPFRAGTLETARAVLAGMASGRGIVSPLPFGTLLILLVGVATHAFALRWDAHRAWERVPRILQGIAYGIVIFLVGLASTRSERFIYFQF